MKLTKADLLKKVEDLESQVGLLKAENADLTIVKSVAINRVKLVEDKLKVMAKEYGAMMEQLIVSEFDLYEEGDTTDE